MNILLLDGNGFIVLGADLDEVFHLADFVEFNAKTAYINLQKQGLSHRPDGPSREEIFSGFLESDHAKYQKALALQHLREDPDGIFMDIKYHFAWNVLYRMPVFKQADDVFDFTYEMFLSCSDAVRGFANLLWLAPDHVHLYIESEGDLSVEAMVEDIKAFSKKSFLEKYPDLMEKNGEMPEIWDGPISQRRSNNRNFISTIFQLQAFSCRRDRLLRESEGYP